MNDEKLYFLAQNDTIQREYTEYKERQRINSSRVKSLERQIFLLKTEVSMAKYKVMKKIKEKEEYLEFIKLINEDDISYIKIIEKLEMMIKINKSDELTKEIVHELIAQSVMDIESVVRRGELIKILGTKTNVLDGEEINRYIYEMVQTGIKNEKAK